MEVSEIGIGFASGSHARIVAKAPWKKAPPKDEHHAQLSSSEKATAKRRAKKAGRRYPNLVDNMNAAKRKKK